MFEVCALHAAGRLRLPRPLEQWIRAALEPSGVRLAPLSLDVAVDAGAIGRDVLSDPLDRLIAATARQMGATLVTRDAGILEYAAGTGSVRVLNAARCSRGGRRTVSGLPGERARELLRPLLIEIQQLLRHGARLA